MSIIESFLSRRLLKSCTSDTCRVIQLHTPSATLPISTLLPSLAVIFFPKQRSHSYGAQESLGLPAGVAESFRQVRSRRDWQTRLSGWSAEVCRGRRHCHRHLGEPPPQ